MMQSVLIFGTVSVLCGILTTAVIAKRCLKKPGLLAALRAIEEANYRKSSRLLQDTHISLSHTLHDAVRIENNSMLKLVLDVAAGRGLAEVGCALDTVHESSRCTPLETALFYNKIENALMLLNAGASLVVVHPAYSVPARQDPLPSTLCLSMCINTVQQRVLQYLVDNRNSYRPLAEREIRSGLELVEVPKVLIDIILSYDERSALNQISLAMHYVAPREDEFPGALPAYSINFPGFIRCAFKGQDDVSLFKLYVSAGADVHMPLLNITKDRKISLVEYVAENHTDLGLLSKEMRQAIKEASKVLTSSE